MLVCNGEQPWDLEFVMNEASYISAITYLIRGTKLRITLVLTTMRLRLALEANQNLELKVRADV
jgi:hypothetical protein